MLAEDGLTECVEAASRAYTRDIEGSLFRSIACSTEGSGLRLLGARDDARRCLEDGMRRDAFVPGAMTVGLAELALISIDDDDWPAAARHVQRAMDVVEQDELGERPAQSIVFAASTLVLAHAGRATDARSKASHTRRLLSMLNHAMPWMAIEARLVLARAELILGDVEAARVLATESEDLLRRFPDAGTLPTEQERIQKAIQAAAGEVGHGLVPLTTAELRVLQFLPTHLSFQAIAEELFVSRNTVKTQAIAIYRKLGVSSRGDAVACAIELGLLDP